MFKYVFAVLNHLYITKTLSHSSVVFFFHREQCYKWLASFFRTQNKIFVVDSDGLSNISNDLEYLIKVSNYFKYCSKLRIPKKILRILKD